MSCLKFTTANEELRTLRKKKKSLWTEEEVSRHAELQEALASLKVKKANALTAQEYPWNSCYAFSENRVIDGVELEGAEYLGVNNENIADNSYCYNDDGTYNLKLGNLVSDNEVWEGKLQIGAYSNVVG